MNEALILALADPSIEAKLRTICNVLRASGETGDYSSWDGANKPGKQRYIDMVTYGVGGITLGQLDKVLNKSK